MEWKWLFTALLAAMFLANGVVGCNGTDLKGYRPASEHAATNVETTTDETKAGADNTPYEVANLRSTEQTDSQMDLPVSALVPVNVIDGIRSLMSIPASETQVADSSKNSDRSGSKSATANTATNDLEPRKVEVLIKDKKFQTEARTGALRVSFDDLDLLKVLNMDPVVDGAVELMPDWLKHLNGKSIRIRGFMYPTYETEGIERFVLARDNQICCFGRDPKIYDLVQVDMKAGKTTDYIPATRAFDVVGKLKIDLQVDDGKPFGLYVLEDATVIDR